MKKITLFAALLFSVPAWAGTESSGKFGESMMKILNRTECALITPEQLNGDKMYQFDLKYQSGSNQTVIVNAKGSDQAMIKVLCDTEPAQVTALRWREAS